MERWAGRVALVTGASAGIGAALTRKLVKDGMKVAVCARRLDRLEALRDELKGEPGAVLPIQCDLRKEDEILAMFEKIKVTWGGVDVCVNNAGMNRNAPLLSGSTDDWRHIIDVNVLALCICTREAVKSMQERGVDDGHIININSTLGHKVGNFPAFHFLMGSKFSVTALTQGTRNELKGLKSHIRASSISPGIVKTEALALSFPDQPELVKHIHYSTKRMEADDVADAVIYALSAPPHVQVEEVTVAGTEDE
ncbi:dehydrogenase/reductase SDR family member 11-like [Liolophura sinensis]|uniref:dehydrogenase/reductase SDR family member 11-like n=1 Tax=Liolophura sinensis TaxID=3198878 RepID=UPI0031591117